MPPGLLEGIFVQRESLAERLVDLFEQSARRQTKHNVLLVGPRGIGKSHLVSLVYHRLKAKEGLADALCVAYLREDEWGINSFLDLLVRTTRVVCEDAGLAPGNGVVDLSERDRSQAEDRVWRSLQTILGNKTLFLIVENLDALFDKIGEEGQRQWRALMQTYPQWAVLATTPALFSGISRQVSPFYGFFEVIHLQPLATSESVALLQKLANWDKDERTVAFLNTSVGRARVRAVQHLAGGNHRIFALFYDFLHQGGSEHLVGPLLKTVDSLTPYYQSQMARLSPQQQKIVNFLCENQKPATVTEIAKNCLTTHQTAASQLRQLLTLRYLRVDRVGRESFYELAEPLLRICVEAKTHRGEPLNLLVDFFRYWFSREELERKLSDMNGREIEKLYYSAALREYDTHDAHTHLTPGIAALCITLSRSNESPKRLEEVAQELAELSKIAEDWPHYARGMGYLRRESDAIPTMEGILTHNERNVQILRSLALLHFGAGSAARAEELINRAIELEPRQGMLLFDKAQILAHTNRQKEAIELFGQAALCDSSLGGLVALHKARLFMQMDKFEDLCETLSPYLTSGGRPSEVDSLFGVGLLGLGKTKDALEYFHKAVKVNENDSLAWGNMGIAYCNMGKYKPALDAFDRVLSLAPSIRQPITFYRLESLLGTNQYEVALETATPEDLSHSVFHRLLRILNSHPKQGKLQQELLRLKSAHESTAWQKAFIGGLIEVASFFKDLDSSEDLKDLGTWNSAIQELFANESSLLILLKLFDVLTRVKVFNDRKALLELPREQRLLLVSEKEEEEFLRQGSAES